METELFEQKIQTYFPEAEKNISVHSFTTFGVGKGAHYLVRAKTIPQFVSYISTALQNDIPFLVLGGGSNVIFPDTELEKLVIVNESVELSVAGNEITVSAGVPLATLIQKAISTNLSGLEALSGIPGTVGGAIVGNAGAYGQTISDTLLSVDMFDGTEQKTLTKEEGLFSYRESIFKKNPWYVLSARFVLSPAVGEGLSKKSSEIIEIRNKKYPPGLKCPGSLFKNVLPSEVSPQNFAKIDQSKIKGGKIPTGYLLEAVGAPGMREGGIFIADYHGNLFINDGTGTAHDVEVLSSTLIQRVQDMFGITLSPEVRFVK